MGVHRNGIAALIALAIAILTGIGCGGDESSSTRKSTSAREGTSVRKDASTFRMGSPAVRKGVIDPRFRCGGESIWLPLKWSAPPPGTKVLVLYFGRYERRAQDGKPKVPFGLLATRMSPDLRGINKLTRNAYPRIYRHFNSCPRGIEKQGFLMRLYALRRPLGGPEALSQTNATEITEAALGVNPSAATSKWIAELTEEALASGGFTATYGPRRGD